MLYRLKLPAVWMLTAEEWYLKPDIIGITFCQSFFNALIKTLFQDKKIGNNNSENRLMRTAYHFVTLFLPYNVWTVIISVSQKIVIRHHSVQRLPYDVDIERGTSSVFVEVQERHVPVIKCRFLGIPVGDIPHHTFLKMS